ncbi:arylsulfatase B-like [Ptychodera flava]|uniref:arylsulfatase B-like n=1 Tax=Ptychodera flava TaxID=63121 RepID=UPI00396A2CAA
MANNKVEPVSEDPASQADVQKKRRRRRIAIALIVSGLAVLAIATIAAIVGVSSLHSGSSPPEEQSPTHIIYMLADDLGWNDLSWHDSSMITPHLQRLADEGVILENLYMMSLCSPSRTSLMTGIYASRTGTQHITFKACRGHGLPTDLTTLPQALKEVGYKTYIVGKWHLGFCNEDYLPNARGFDKFFGFYKGGFDFYNHSSSEFGPYSPGQYLGYDLHEDIAGQPSIQVTDNVTYSTELFRDKILEYIEDHDPSDPMFLFVPFQQPHMPTDVPTEWADMYKETVSDLIRRNYSGQVTIMDDVVGDIRTKLEERGMFEDSLLIFHGDHGGDVQYMASNWPYRGNKGTFFEGGIKGAGLISGKGIEKTGYRNYELYHVTDIFPTLVESVAKGTVDSNDLDGMNVWESLSTGSPSPRDEFLIVVDEDITNDTEVAALRYGDWKLIEGYPAFIKDPSWALFDWYKPPYHGMDVIEGPPLSGLTTYLFNLRDDPFEEHNLADNNPEMVDFLHNKLDEYREASIPPFWPPILQGCDPQLYNGFWSPGFC